MILPMVPEYIAVLPQLAHYQRFPPVVSAGPIPLPMTPFRPNAFKHCNVVVICIYCVTLPCVTSLSRSTNASSRGSVSFDKRKPVSNLLWDTAVTKLTEVSLLYEQMEELKQSKKENMEQPGSNTAQKLQRCDLLALKKWLAED